MILDAGAHLILSALNTADIQSIRFILFDYASHQQCT